MNIGSDVISNGAELLYFLCHTRYERTRCVVQSVILNLAFMNYVDNYKNTPAADFQSRD